MSLFELQRYNISTKYLELYIRTVVEVSHLDELDPNLQVAQLLALSGSWMAFRPLN